MYRSFMTWRNPYFIVVWYTATVIACGAVVYQYGWRFGGLFGIVGGVYPAYMAVHAMALRTELRRRGYDWVTYGAAFTLSARHWSRVWRLPHRNLAAAIPGYEDNVQGLQKVIQQAHDMPETPQGMLPEVKQALQECRKHPPPAPMYGWRKIVFLYWFFVSLYILFNAAATAVCVQTAWTNAWIYSLNVLILPVYMTIIGLALHGHLTESGYTVTRREAFFTGARLQALASRIPRADDLAEFLQTEDPIDMNMLIGSIMGMEMARRKTKRRPVKS